MKQLFIPIAILAGLFYFAKNAGGNIQPELRELSINKKLTNLATLVLDAKIRVVNASPATISINSILGSVSFKDQKIASINHLRTETISARAFNEFIVPVYIDTLTAGGNILNAFMDFKKKIVPVLRVQARINTPFGGVDIDKLQPLA
jgi:LEA14-like dessication related protein